ncbi:DNA ligase [Shewanella psychrotolerans]|uniref:DNA ligase n=1 Tax=Shewanella psychrotolerans TaxID=2864206 RepID=UPI001C65A999|nr:DNA ligase [Shewanella psychrotolerans]QYK00138.1 DNA ligase [Shewanella psychrotolerans]
MWVYLSRIIVVVLLFIGLVPNLLSQDIVVTADKHQRLKLQHAGSISPQLPISEYFVSEKLDGVRGFWNGTTMYTRSGRKIALPDWFVHGFPAQALDGELWIARGKFDDISGLVRQTRPDQERWRQVKFMVFDLPESKQPFEVRYRYAVDHFSHLSPFLRVISQRQYDNRKDVDQLLTSVVDAGGEGLMLHRRSAIYLQGRNNDVVKLKQYQDAEAVVIGHYPGKGKYEGMLGALEVKAADGTIFRLGTGFSDEQRKKPPRIGSSVTYKYYGLTKLGVPRFASFVRVRLEQ